MPNNEAPAPANSAESMFWGDASATPLASPSPSPSPRPAYVPSFQARLDRDDRWRWRYSWFTGVWFGPIPLGLVVGIVYLLVR